MYTMVLLCDTASGFDEYILMSKFFLVFYKPLQISMNTNIIVKYNCIKEKAHQFYRVLCNAIYISYKTHPCSRQALIPTFLVADSSLHHQTALLSALPPLPLTRHFRHHYMFTGKTKKSRIHETKHLSTDADRSTDAIGGWTKNTPKPRGGVLHYAKPLKYNRIIPIYPPHIFI